MAYTNETTHYSIPLPLGSDLTTPMDYNESMQGVDTALFEAKTDSGSALQKANQLQQDLATTNDNVTAVAGRVTTLEGTSVTQGQAILQNKQDIADVRADALDMIEAKDEGTAQVASVAVNKGEYFRYNDVLYIATSNIAINDTIVPNENCRATNVGTELTQMNGDLAYKEIVIEGDGTSTTLASLLNTLYSRIAQIGMLSGDSYIKLDTNIFPFSAYNPTSGVFVFNREQTTGNSLVTDTLEVRTTGSENYRCTVNTSGATFTTRGSAISDGFTLYYKLP